MKDKTNARIEGNEAGANAKTDGEIMHKDRPLPDFPKTKPDNPDLNAPPPLVNGSEPPSEEKKSAKKETKILEVQRFLKNQYQFRYNTVKNAVEFAPKGKNVWSDIDERTANKLEAELLFAGYTGIQRILHVLLSNSEIYDPIHAYLDTLPDWNDQTDHIEALANFVKVEKGRRDWFNWMLKKHLVRTLACATGQLAFNKHCFVLVSGQNDGKTSFLRYLCPSAWSEYYTEDIDFENKDGLIALARNVFVNLDELRNLSRQDINKVKSFISKDSIKARLPFDRRETKLKRNASFFGSTNNAEFLTDETGNVRWLVFEIEGIEHDNGGQNGYCQIDINQVWAQAYALLKQGFQYQLTREEIERSEGYNQAHTVRPIEYDMILKYYDESENDKDFKTPAEIKIRLDVQSSNKLSVVNIGKALRMLKIERKAKKVKRQTLYGYYLKETAELLLGEAKEDENKAETEKTAF